MHTGNIRRPQGTQLNSYTQYSIIPWPGPWLGRGIAFLKGFAPLAQTGITGLVDEFEYVAPGRAGQAGRAIIPLLRLQSSQ